MVYSATARRSRRNGKWFFLLDRDGRTCVVSDASYHTREAAIRAARRKAGERMAKLPLPALVGNIKFKVSK